MTEPSHVEVLKDTLGLTDSEDDEPVPWTLDALGDDYGDEKIISTLTDEEHYTYHTRKSMKALFNLFKIKCEVAEEQYLEKQ
jgi:hypothetical protein